MNKTLLKQILVILVVMTAVHKIEPVKKFVTGDAGWSFFGG